MKGKSKVAIITGAGGGLGFLTATLMQKAGYEVVACDLHPPQKASFPCSTVDVTDERQVRKFVKKVAKDKGRIDVLVNNAGYSTPLQSIKEASKEDVLNCFQINVYGPFYFMRETIPIMERQGEGRIINMASKAAVYANPMLAVYSASKSALLTLTQSIAKELRDKKSDVQCFVVSPSGMKTKMREKLYGKASMKNQMDPKVVADAVVEMAHSGTVSQFAAGNRKPSHADVPHGANVIIRGGNAVIKMMEDG